MLFSAYLALCFLIDFNDSSRDCYTLYFPTPGDLVLASKIKLSKREWLLKIFLQLQLSKFFWVFGFGFHPVRVSFINRSWFVFLFLNAFIKITNFLFSSVLFCDCGEYFDFLGVEIRVEINFGCFVLVDSLVLDPVVDLVEFLNLHKI